jgi:CTP:molybdopterin cytidylyltransferase MocA
VVLAAGGGSRYAGGGHKLLAPFRGKPLVLWAVDSALAADLDETLVVTGAVALSGVLPAGVTVVDNPRWAAGQATSLHAAVEHAKRRGHAAVVVGLGDQPLVPAESWRRVAAVVAAVAGGGPPIAVATYAGQRRNPVGMARVVWDLLPAAGDAGARVLMARRPDLVGEVACEGEPADVDTVEDLEQWS